MTAHELRISDCSSDVCSSDLHRIADEQLTLGDRPVVCHQVQGRLRTHRRQELAIGLAANRELQAATGRLGRGYEAFELPGDPLVLGARDQIGRASCRERVCPYV